MEDIQTIIISILLVAGFLAVIVALKWWLDRQDPGKLAEFRDLIVELIYEAEELLGDKGGAAKLDWVILRCRDAGILRWIPEKLLIQLINLAVHTLNETHWRPWPDGSDTGGDDGPAGPGPEVQPGPATEPARASAPTFDAVDAMLYAGFVGKPVTAVDQPPARRARLPRRAAIDLAKRATVDGTLSPDSALSLDPGSGEASQPASDGGQDGQAVAL